MITHWASFVTRWESHLRQVKPPTRSPINASNIFLLHKQNRWLSCRFKSVKGKHANCSFRRRARGFNAFVSLAALLTIVFAGAQQQNQFRLINSFLPRPVRLCWFADVLQPSIHLFFFSYLPSHANRTSSTSMFVFREFSSRLHNKSRACVGLSREWHHRQQKSLHDKLRQSRRGEAKQQTQIHLTSDISKMPRAHLSNFLCFLICSADLKAS